MPDLAPLLTNRQLVGALLGNIQSLSEEDAVRFLDWALRALANAHLVQSVIDGTTVPKWNGHEWEFTHVPVPEPAQSEAPYHVIR